MSMRNVWVTVIPLGLPTLASADELEGDYLYKVTTIRAAAGTLQGLLEWEADLAASEYYADAGQEHQELAPAEEHQALPAPEGDIGEDKGAEASE